MPASTGTHRSNLVVDRLRGLGGEGTGKTTRHIKLKSAGGIDKDAVADHIRQAVAVDRS
jgi:hypothetical protein